MLQKYKSFLKLQKKRAIFYKKDHSHTLEKGWRRDYSLLTQTLCEPAPLALMPELGLTTSLASSLEAEL